jgi:hypothetical protein
MPNGKIRKDDDPLTVIVAGNFTEFNHYCYVHHINPRSRDHLYVDSSIRLAGLARPITVVRIGTYHSRRDLPEIEGMIRVIQARQEDKDDQSPST